MKTYVSSGKDLTLTVPEGGVVAGTAYLVSGLVVIATKTVASGSFVGRPVGVFTVPKVEAEAWAEGEKIYFDSDASPDPIFTDQSSGNVLVGAAVSSAPANLKIESSGAGVGLTINRNVITITDYSKLADATVTVIVDGVATVLTEGSGQDWAAETGNNETATSLASTIDGVTGVAASASQAVVTAQAGVGTVRLDGVVR